MLNGNGVNGHGVKVSAEQEIADYERDVKQALDSFRRRSHFVAAERKTPLTELMYKEENGEAAASEDDEGAQKERWRLRAEGIRAFLIYWRRMGRTRAM